MSVMNALFDAFEEANINYVHFKSNANLNDSFAGKGDFDVLVDKNKICNVESIILVNQGRRHNPDKIGDYPGVDNWLVFDDETGIYYHLHLHYQLATGKALVKDYVIPWTDYIFLTRVKDKKYDIFITNPNLELILLSVRTVLKSRAKDWITSALGFYKMFPPLAEERNWLLHNIDVNLVKKFAGDLFGNDVDEFVSIIVKDTLSSSDYNYLSRFVRKAMRNNRRMSGMEAQFKTVLYRFWDLKNKFLTRKLGIMHITKKRAMSGGLIIAFVGVDGAGKSTMTKEINAWMSKKIECTRFYMGTGDGKTTLYAAFLKKVRKLLGTKSSVGVAPDLVAGTKKISFAASPFTYIKKWLMVTLIYDVEKSNYNKIIKMYRYKLNGGISLLDRYPQIEEIGQNDGPKIPFYEELLGTNVILRYLKAKEMEKLGVVKEIKPDIIFRLNISPNVALQRKNESNDERVKKFLTNKIESLQKLHFQGALIIDIDAEQPYEQELLEVKRILWRYI